MLPESLPRLAGIDLAARYLPGTAELDVGGDWFDAIQLGDGRLGLVVGDVVGKGVQAAARWVSSGTRCGRSPSIR